MALSEFSGRCRISRCISSCCRWNKRERPTQAVTPHRVRPWTSRAKRCREPNCVRPAHRREEQAASGARAELGRGRSWLAVAHRQTFKSDSHVGFGSGHTVTAKLRPDPSCACPARRARGKQQAEPEPRHDQIGRRDQFDAVAKSRLPSLLAWEEAASGAGAELGRGRAGWACRSYQSP